MNNSLTSFRKKDVAGVDAKDFHKGGNDKGDIDDDKKETIDVNVDTDCGKDVDNCQGDLDHVPEVDDGPARVMTVETMMTGWSRWKSRSSVTPSPHVSSAHLQLLDIPTTIKTT